MSAFSTEVTVKPSFDHRFDPAKWQRGCGSMELQFALRGPLGVITASIMTGWMANPLKEIPNGYGGAPKAAWTNPVRSEGKVGPDCLSRGFERPLAGPVSCHAETPPQGKEWFSAAPGCQYFDGGTCYGDSGYLVGDTFILRLATGGTDDGFAFLREIHDDWLAPELTAEATP